MTALNETKFCRAYRADVCSCIQESKSGHGAMMMDDAKRKIDQRGQKLMAKHSQWKSVRKNKELNQNKS